MHRRTGASTFSTKCDCPPSSAFSLMSAARNCEINTSSAIRPSPAQRADHPKNRIDEGVIEDSLIHWLFTENGFASDSDPRDRFIQRRMTALVVEEALVVTIEGGDRITISEFDQDILLVRLHCNAVPQIESKYWGHQHC